MQIYERVFDILQQKKISQKEFSERTGIPQSTISDWKGKHANPAADKIMIICQALGVTPYDILSGAESDKYESVDYLMINRNSEEHILVEKSRRLSKVDYGRLMGYLDALLEEKKYWEQRYAIDIPLFFNVEYEKEKWYDITYMHKCTVKLSIRREK